MKNLKTFAKILKNKKDTGEQDNNKNSAGLYMKQVNVIPDLKKIKK